MALTLWTDDPQRGPRELAEIAHTLETELKRIPGTRDVFTIGAPDRAVMVELDATRLASYGLAVEDLAGALQAANLARQAGERVGADGVVQVTSGTFRSEEHTSELQSLMRISYAVFCLKKKKRTKDTTSSTS